MREVARCGLQMSTDRAADLITVPTVALPEGQFDCNLLLRNGVPAYRIETAVATIHFVVDGDERSAKITATANFGRSCTSTSTGRGLRDVLLDSPLRGRGLFASLRPKAQ